MTTTPTAYLEYEGAPVPARELAWYTIAPCGCTEGVQTTDAGDNGMLLTTEQQAWDNGMGSKAIRDRDRALGCKMELGRRADVTTRLGGDCPHTPKWGMEKTPTPDGHHWAHAGGRARRIHLVPGTPTEHYRITVENWRDDAKIAALCGAEEYSWDTGRWLISDYLECGKCATAAKAAQ